MMRTIELVVGLHPLTQFDAYATPMLAAFTNKPDPTRPQHTVFPAPPDNQSATTPPQPAPAAQGDGDGH
jgi:hypothetical protein